jgi:hypothetical protein
MSRYCAMTKTVLGEGSAWFASVCFVTLGIVLLALGSLAYSQMEIVQDAAIGGGGGGTPCPTCNGANSPDCPTPTGAWSCCSDASGNQVGWYQPASQLCCGGAIYDASQYCCDNGTAVQDGM